MEASEAYALTITPSLCDFDGKLSIPDCFSVFQDIAADHAERLGVGADAMINRGLFWLTVKTKIRFLRRPAMPETVTVSRLSSIFRSGFLTGTPFTRTVPARIIFTA